jgi:hypothetical protein
MNDKDLSTAFNSKWLDTLGNTALQVAPTFILGGGSVGLDYYVREPLAKRRGQAFAATQDLSNFIPEQKSQFFARLAMTRSAAYTNAVLATMLGSGNITQEEFDNIAPYVANMEQNQEMLFQAKNKGANSANQMFLSHLLAEQNRLAGLAQQDPSLQPQLDELNKRISYISQGKNEDMYIIKYKDGSWFSFDEKTFKSLFTNEEFVNKLKNKDVSIGFVFNDKTTTRSKSEALFEELYGVKPPSSVDKAPSLSEKELDQSEKDALDKKVKDFQERTGYKPDELTVDTNSGVTIDRLSMGIPVDMVAVDEASKSLYQRYKQYENMLNSTSRLMTTEQITGLMTELEGLITKLENVKNGKDFNAEVETKTGPVEQQAEQAAAEPASAEPQAVKSYADSIANRDLEQGYGEDTVEGIVDGQYYNDLIESAKAEGVSAEKVMKDLLRNRALDNLESREDLENLEAKIKQDLATEAKQAAAPEVEPIDEFVDANYQQIMADLKLKNRLTTSGCGY